MCYSFLCAVLLCIHATLWLSFICSFELYLGGMIFETEDYPSKLVCTSWHRFLSRGYLFTGNCPTLAIGTTLNSKRRRSLYILFIMVRKYFWIISLSFFFFSDGSRSMEVWRIVCIKWKTEQRSTEKFYNGSCWWLHLCWITINPCINT